MGRCTLSDTRVSTAAIMIMKSEFRRHNKVSDDRRGVISIASINTPSHDPPNSRKPTHSQDYVSPRLREFLLKFKGRFSEPTTLPPARDEDMHIELEPDSAIPKWRPIGKLSKDELIQLKQQLADMMNRGHIQPSTSPYGASILFVKKPDGSLRMCIDYRGLNDITVKNRCPIPNIEEMRSGWCYTLHQT